MYAYGIYLDNYTTLSKIIGNTCYENSSAGILLGYTTKDNEITGNLCYNNYLRQVEILNDDNFDANAYTTTGTTFKNNTLVSLSTTQEALRIFDAQTNDHNPFSSGAAKNNTLISPYNSNPIEGDAAMTLAAAITLYGESIGQQDSYSTSFVNEATAKANVPLEINTTASLTIAITPEDYHSPLNKLYDPLLAPYQGATFITGAISTSSQWADISSGGNPGINYPDGFVAINTTSPFPGIASTTYSENSVDINGAYLFIGSNENYDGLRTNSFGKAARIVVPHYTNTEEPVGMLIGGSGSSDNFVIFGGGSSHVNAATYLSFYTGANQTTTTGTERMNINSSGAVAISGSTLTLGGVAVPTISSTNTLTNKRWTPRVGSTTSSATPTINTDNVDVYKLTAQTADITSFTTNLTGTPNDGDVLVIEITGTASRALTFGASFVASTVALPTTTSGTTTLTIIFQYKTTSSYGNNKWHMANSF